jgi:hypothetical protein
MLVCDWLHSVGQNHFYVMMLIKLGFHQSSNIRLDDKNFPSEFPSVSRSFKLFEVANARTSIYTIWMLNPYYGNCVQQKCNCSDTRATLSGCGSIQERISTNLESQLHSCPSGCPQLLSRCRLEKIDLDSI